VPLGGKYRLVDIPISNCLNGGFCQIYLLTQFNSKSLHRHITASYQFDNFTKSFIEILAAQQTPEGARWYQGTADAVRQNLRQFLEHPYEYYLVLSGDHLYRMDYRDLLHAHMRTGADVSLGTTQSTDRRLRDCRKQRLRFANAQTVAEQHLLLQNISVPSEVARLCSDPIQVLDRAQPKRE
jgi:ADP-glucose pyrophosphorylase